MSLNSHNKWKELFRRHLVVRNSTNVIDTHTLVFNTIALTNKPSHMNTKNVLKGNVSLR